MQTDPEFREMLRTFAFLALDMVSRGVYVSNRERESLQRIVSICDSAEIWCNWKNFKGRPIEQQYNDLVTWWKSRGVIQSAIEALDFEYRRFSDEVKDFKRRRLAGERPQEIVMKQLRGLIGPMDKERSESDLTPIGSAHAGISTDGMKRMRLVAKYLDDCDKGDRAFNSEDQQKYIEDHWDEEVKNAVG